MYRNLKNIASIKDKRAVVLQSGGLDSCYIANLLHHYGFSLHHLYVDYGQNSRSQELAAAQKIVARTNGELHIVTLDMPWLSTSTKLVGDQHIEEYAVPKKFGCIEAGTYVPLRNHVLLSLAGSLAEALQIPYIAAGLDGDQDLFGTPKKGTTDKHQNFARDIERSISEGSTLKHLHGKNYSIIAPLIGDTKEAEIIHGTKLGFHWEDSWTCYNNSSKPCGTCCACVDRKLHFKNVGISDPTDYLE